MAANELLKAINEKFNSTETTPVTVIVNVFANVTGLGKAMKRDGCVADNNALHNFVMGFNQANVSSTFVDVGFGKELADAKILGIYPLLYTSFPKSKGFCLTYRQILLGFT